jgi:DsbC/DsbD-like thiol-disulfide interchange protein
MFSRRAAKKKEKSPYLGGRIRLLKMTGAVPFAASRGGALMNRIFHFVVLTAVVLTAVFACGADEPLSLVQFFAAYKTVRPGDRLPVAVKITVAEGWHTYSKEPGDSGMPPSIRISGIDGLEVGGWRFPPPQTFTDSVGTTYGYEKNVVLFSEVLIPETVPVGISIGLTASINWMICRDVCVFQKDAQTVAVQSGTASSGPSAEWQSLLKNSGWEKPYGESTGNSLPGKEQR